MKFMEAYSMFYKHLLKQQRAQKPVRLLGLHVGDKHVGVAVADLDVHRAKPYCVWHRKDSNSIAQTFQHLIREEYVRGILVGVPVENQEDDVDLTQLEVFVKELPKIPELNDVRYTYWDDTLTLSQNVEYLLAPFQLDQKIMDNVFKRSAAAVLQHYLDDVRNRSLRSLEAHCNALDDV